MEIRLEVPLRPDSHPSPTHRYSTFSVKRITQRCKIPGLCCKNWQFSCVFSTQQLTRDGWCRVRFHHPSQEQEFTLQSGVYREKCWEGCHSADYNIINSYWSQCRGEVGWDGEELSVEEHQAAAERRWRIQHWSRATRTLRTLTSHSSGSRQRGPAPGL